jgi:hypothetical protein
VRVVEGLLVVLLGAGVMLLLEGEKWLLRRLGVRDLQPAA